MRRVGSPVTQIPKPSCLQKGCLVLVVALQPDQQKALTSHNYFTAKAKTEPPNGSVKPRRSRADSSCITARKVRSTGFGNSTASLPCLVRVNIRRNTISGNKNVFQYVVFTLLNPAARKSSCTPVLV